MDEDKLLKEMGKTVDVLLEARLKEIVGPEIAAATRRTVEEIRLERAAFGYDRTGLSDAQKVDVARCAKAICFGHGSLKSGEELISEVDSRGGYLLPTEVAKAIERIAYSVGVAMSQVTKWPMGSDQLDIPAYTGSILTGSYLGVNAAGDITAVTFKNARLALHKWQLAFALGKDLLAEASVDLGSWLLALAGEALANMVDRQVFTGGSTAGDPFTGILNCADSALTTQTLATGENTFEEYRVIEDSAIAIGNVEETVLAEAAFFFSRTVWANLRVQKDDAGQFLLGSAGQGASQLARLLGSDPKSKAGPAPVGEILGYPVYAVRHLPALSASAASTKFGIFGNLRNVGFGSNGEMKLERYDSGTFGGKEIALADQTGLVFKQKHAVTITLPGAFNVIKTAVT